MFFGIDFQRSFLKTITTLCVHIYLIQMCEDMAKNQVLSNIENLLQQHGKKLVDFCGMPQVDRSLLFLPGGNLLTKETMFNVLEQTSMAIEMERTLNYGQRNAYNHVIQAIETANGSIVFLDGPGGTGKNYLYNALVC